MKWLDRIRALGRAQRSTPFRIVASVIVLVGTAAAAVSYYVAATAPVSAEAAPPPASPTAEPDVELPAAMRSRIEQSRRLLEEVLARQADPMAVALAAALAAAWLLIWVWLGLGMTLLALAAATGIVAALAWLLPGARGLAVPLVGLIWLTATCAMLVAAARAALAASFPPVAIARTVLVEALRLKVSLVFVVLLVFALAALPSLLNEASPLRYRVQSFLQYGTGGSYWLIALLTIFFGCATVAFEQRDRQIWQTVTKPVAPWQYVLGKWLGVVTVDAILLAVCASGVFVFTEYLRQQPALGEGAIPGAAMIELTSDGGEPRRVSLDRFLLETQVLVAREAIGPRPPVGRNDPTFQHAVDQFIERERRGNAFFQDTPETRARIHDQLYESYVRTYFAIAPGDTRTYRFDGLERARRVGRSLVLRYRIDAGDNRPDQIYSLTFVIGAEHARRQQVGLGVTHTLWPIDPSLIDEHGGLELSITNGQWAVDDRGQVGVIPNELTISIPPGGLELTYPVGTFGENYLRAALVLWCKLALLAIVAIASASFLSFPVACLLTMGVFLAGEGANFIAQSLEVFGTTNREGQVVWAKVVVHAVASAVSAAFSGWARLAPVASVVEGRLIGLTSVASALFAVVGPGALIYAAGVAVFRRRELAIYSGH